MRAIIAFSILAILGMSAAQETAKQAGKNSAGPLTVVDGDGKDHVMMDWSITGGTRRYVLDGQPAKKDKGEPAKGQEYIEFREDNSTTLKEGILTLVPLSSVRQLDYDVENRSVTLTLVQADLKSAKISGTTKFIGINKFTVEGSIDLGGGMEASVKYLGGVANAKPGVRGFHFPFKNSAPKATGLTMVLKGVDENKTEHKVQDLRALYRAGNAERVSELLAFKGKNVKFPLTKIVSMRRPDDADDYEIKLADGKQLPPLTLLENVLPDDGSEAALVGLLGRVPAGYKLFPMHTISELRREGE